MTPITGTEIVSAVCTQLASIWDFPIYNERIDQDFQEPCFFVWCSQTRTEPVVWPRFEQRHDIEVRFYPDNVHDQNSTAAVKSIQLIECLHRILIPRNDSTPLPVFAQNYSSRIVDDALVFSVQYRTEGYFYETPAPKMGDLQDTIQSKEG